MDLSKAFDTLDHKILWTKLKFYGLGGVSLSLLRTSYLSNRSQHVELDGTKSDYRSIITGVPQGSILGPLLFTIYINYINRACSSLDSILYADDTTLLFPDKSQNEQWINLYVTISNWFQANKLSLNIDKTKFMIFHRPKSKAPTINLKINGISLERVSTFKFHGLTLNENLTWDNHYWHINKIARVVGIMNKLKFTVPKYILLTLYQSLILPHLNFQIICWGTAGDISNLVKLQKRAVRVITRSKYLAHASPLFIELKLLKLPDLIKIAMLRYYHIKITNKLPKYFSNWKFRRGQDFHNHYTRDCHTVLYTVHHYDYYEKLLKYSLIDLLITFLLASVKISVSAALQAL